jgi:hypothetical protein
LRLMGQYIAMPCFGDAHVPDHDEAACGALRAFLKYLKPELGFIAGDMWGASNFGKYKKKVDPIARLRSGQEIKTARELNLWLMDSCGAEWHVVGSNHEDRLRHEIWAMMPELWTIEGIRENASIPELLGYREHGAVFHESVWYPRPWLKGMHGEVVRKWAGMSVRGEMLEHSGVATIMGHGHRLCVWSTTLDSGTLTGMECGHLGKNPPDYKHGRTQDWQQGIGVAWLHKKKPIARYEVCPIEDGVLWWRGMEFSA